MSSVPPPAPPAPPWRGPPPTPATPGPAWRSAPVRPPHRPRWRRLAVAAALGLGALALVTWVVFWIRPPAPARVVILAAGYERTLAVPPNPYGRADARELAALARPGSWLGTRSRLNGGPVGALARTGLPDLSAAREKCVLVFVAAHGGRDRDGPFLFPEDASGEPADRVRFRTLLDQLNRLPASKQKLLVIDATRAPAFGDLGLVHNDFAAAVEEMDGEIAAVPNLAVLLSSGPDERSWASPEWGASAFAHFALAGLNGGADADGNGRVTAGELVSYVTPLVSDWARDNRGSRQVPLLLPRGDGPARAREMHLVSVDGRPAALAAPEPFDPPPELEAQWEEYRELANATPPPTAYTPHLWRQYEAWALRHEELILAGDAAGARAARASAAEVRRKIEAARALDVSPQTLTLQAAIGGRAYVATVPESIKLGIDTLAREPIASRAKKWAELRTATGDTEATRLLWCRALVEWTAADPVPRRAVAGDLIPLVADGLAVRPAEVNFLAMLARHLPPADKKDVIGPLLTEALQLRLKAEQTAAAFAPDRAGKTPYPFAEVVYPLLERPLSAADITRRETEDRCFATDAADWSRALDALKKDKPFDARFEASELARDALAAFHRDAHAKASEAEWVARGVGERVSVEAEIAALLEAKAEFDAKPAPRADAVKWFHRAEAVLSAPGGDRRAALAREFRRVSRQLLVTGETRPDPQPEVGPAKAREVAFEAARRRGERLLGRFGGAEPIRTLSTVRPGEDFAALNDRLDTFAFRADGRASLANFGSRCGELFAAVASLAANPDAYRAADRWVRTAPAHTAISDAPIDRVRRERVRGYLAFQARRTFEDHWYGEGGTRYYHTAVQRLANDAAGIVAAFAPSDDPFKPHLIAEPAFPVEPKLSERIAITDEPNPIARVGFRGNAVPGVAGFPVFWTDPTARTAISTTPGAAVLERPLTRSAPPQPLTPKAQTEALAVSGFFRGRAISASTPVDFYAVPDRAAVGVPLAPTVGIAVRANSDALKRYGFGTGAVAIVLDCSGSMARDPKDPTSVGLYPEALAALEKLLKGLPPGTTVTVWTFGQRTFGIKAPEETIRELLAPTALPLDAKNLIENVLQKARGLEPWHESPVVRAAVTAKNRVRDLKLPFKAVVLLSDAVDNRFAVDPEFGGNQRTIGDVLRAEFPPEVAFGVVAFPVGREEQAAQGEFKLVEKLMPAGKFVPPADVEKLIEWLRTGLNPRVRYTLESVKSGARGEPLAAGTAEFDNWYAGRLAPGAYRLRVEKAALTGNIALLPGDRLLLDLIEDGGTLTLRRRWFADATQSAAQAGASDGAWRAALLQNWAQAGRVELFAAIESNPKRLDPLSATRIGDAWFEVVPSVPKPEPVAVRWRAEGGFPAPVWSLASPGWPLFPGTTAHAAPRVEAWWSPEPFAAAAEVKALDRGSLTVAGAAVSFNVTFEEHEVEVSPGVRAKRACVAVRVSHAPKSPVFARPLGAPPEGAGREVRVYEGASRTTSLFWWPDLDAGAARASGFEFVSLNDALRAAEKGMRHLTLTPTGPTETSARPEPPTK